MKRSRLILLLLMMSITFQSAQLNASIFDFFRKTTTDVINYFSKNPAHAVCLGAFCIFGWNQYRSHRMIVKLNTEVLNLRSRAGDLEEKPALTAETVTHEIEKTVVKKITEVYTEPLKQIDKMRGDVDNANNAIKNLITAETVDQKIKVDLKEVLDLVETLNKNIKLTEENISGLNDRITPLETAKVEKDAPQIVEQINEISCEFNCQKKHEELKSLIETEVDNINNNFTELGLGLNKKITEIKEEFKQLKIETDKSLKFTAECQLYVEEIRTFVESLKQKYDEGLNKQFSEIAIKFDELQKQLKVQHDNKDIKRVRFDEPLASIEVKTSSQAIGPLNLNDLPSLTNLTPVNKVELLDSIEKNVDTKFEFDPNEINAAQQKLSEYQEENKRKLPEDLDPTGQVTELIKKEYPVLATLHGINDK